MVDVVGLRFVAEGERDATNALKRFSDAQEKLTRSVLDGAARVQSVSSAWDRANRLYKEGVIGANALRAAQTQVARELAVLNDYTKKNGALNTQRALAELKAAQAARENAEATRRQAEATQRAQQGYDRLRASIDPVFAAQQRMRQAHETVRQALANETITRQQAAQTLTLYRQRLREAGQSTVTTADHTSRLRQQFLAAANSIAILDGPLGGVASRFSALGVLIGRTGVLLATVAVGFTALGTAIGQSIRVGMAAETSMLSLETSVRATGGAAGVTARQIEAMSRTIEAQTLASRDGVRQAAVQLLTFESVAGPMFERTLRVSQDIAQAFQRDIVAVSLQVAKALENPAQSLASLERAYGALRPGIRATVVALVEQGRQTEAMNVLMAELERRFNGAGQAAAAGLAGQLDTLRAALTDFRQRLFDIVNGNDRVQGTFAGLTTVVVVFTNSLDTLTRIAQVVALYFGARGVISIGLRLYTGATALASMATLTLSGALVGLRAALVATGVGIPLVALGALWAYFDRSVSSANRLRQELDRLRDAAQDNIGTTTQFTAEMSRLSRVTLDVAQANLEEARTRRAGLAVRQAEMEAVVAAESSFQRLLQRRQGLVAALDSLDLGVQEAFSPGHAERMSAELAQIEEQLQRTMMGAVPPELRAAFADLDVLIENFQTGIENVVGGFVVLGDGSRAFTSDVQQSVDAFLLRIAAQERELELLNQGLSTQEARTQMERDALVLESERLLQRAREIEATKEISAETQQTVDRLREAAEKALELADGLETAQQASDVRSQLENTLEGLQNQLDVLDMQIVLLEQGVDFTLAQRLAEIELQRARVQTQIVTEGITDELAAQLALINAMSGTVIEIGDRQARVEGFKPTRGDRERAESAERAAAAEERGLNAVRIRAGLALDRVDRLATLQQELALQLALNQHGADSVEVAAMQRAAHEATLRAQENVTEEIIRAEMALYDAKDAANGMADASGGITSQLNGAVSAALRLRDAMAAAGRASLSRQDEASVLRAQISAAERGLSVPGAKAATETALELGRSGATFDQIAAESERARAEAATNEALSRQLSALTSPARADAGGAGGGGAAELATLTSITDAMLLRIERERELMGLQGIARRERELTLEIEEQLRQSGQMATEEAIQNAAREIAAREAVNETIRQQQSEMERIGKLIESSMTDAFMSIVDGTKSAEDAFKDMARLIIAELFKVLVVQQLVGQFSSGGGGILGALAGGFNLNANGNAFMGGNVIPFARGGVVGSPTMFPMAGGSTGLMGEAGPEAIMPLKRGKDGKLGVASEGGGNVSIVQHFNVSANGDESVKRIVAQQVPAIAEATKAAVIDARQRGGKMRATFR
jgi:hypothetical protein